MRGLRQEGHLGKRSHRDKERVGMLRAQELRQEQMELVVQQVAGTGPMLVIAQEQGQGRWFQGPEQQATLYQREAKARLGEES